jgi:hypothetical protein
MKEGHLSQRSKFVRENYSFAPSGAYPFSTSIHGLRRGLHSCAASRLEIDAMYHFGFQDPVPTHTLKALRHPKSVGRGVLGRLRHPEAASER